MLNGAGVGSRETSPERSRKRSSPTPPKSVALCLVESPSRVLRCGNLPIAFYVVGISQSRFTLCNLPVAFPVRHPTILWLKCKERSWAIAKGLARSFVEAYQREMPDKCCQHRVDPVQERWDPPWWLCREEDCDFDCAIGITTHTVQISYRNPVHTVTRCCCFGV